MTGPSGKPLKGVLWFALPAAILLLANLLFANGSSPDLSVIDAKTLPALKADFNAHADATRIVLLLSPT